MSNKDLFVNSGNNLLIVDCLNLCFRFKHERYKADDIAPPEWATLDDLVEVMREELEDKYFFTEYVNTVESLARSYKASKIVLVADLGGSTWRKNLYPEYKGDRAEKYANEPLINQAASKVFMEHYKRLLEDLADYEEFELIVEYGIEADDLATYLVLNHSDKYEHTWLVSSDEDWDLLIRDNVSRFNWMCKNTWKNVTKTGPRPKEITVENWSEHHAYTQEQYLCYKALTADEDNIHGVTGIGPKRGFDLINKYGTLEKLIAALPITTSKAAYIRELNAYGEQLKLNKKLMDLVSYNKEIIPINVERIVARLF